jgi:hypothetical protein
MNCLTSVLLAHLALAFLAVTPTRGGNLRLISPVEASGFTRITSYDSLQAFVERLRESPGIAVDRIGTTMQGRSIVAVRITSSPAFGSDPTKLRVLLFGQQHGDESTGKEALTMLLAGIASGEMKEVLARLDLLIVPQMNPDGAELGQRRTADSIDLNRNHALLTTPNTKALHDLFYRWMPHVTMDIHQYGAYSTSWSDSGFIKRGDVQLGMLTNVNTPAAVRELQHDRIFPFIAERMKSKGYSFHEYIVGSPSDRIRHSTTEINDGRQGFGILGTVSFIQEGVRWMTPEEQLERCVRSHLASIEALLQYCKGHGTEIREVVETERSHLPARAGSQVAVRMEHRTGDAVLDIPVRVVKTGLDTLWRVHPYHSEVHMLTDVTMPSGYIVPQEDSAVIALLSRHHIVVDTIRSARTLQAFSALIDSVGWQVLEEDSLPRVFARWTEIDHTLQPGDFFVRTAQLQSLLITILLEPESMWGLPKYGEFAFLLRRQTYPVLRIP